MNNIKNNIAKFYKLDFGKEESKNLSEWCKYVEKNIEIKNPNCISLFNNLLVEYGFDWGHDYTDSSWEIQEIKYYRVNQNFPKISFLSAVKLTLYFLLNGSLK